MKTEYICRIAYKHYAWGGFLAALLLIASPALGQNAYELKKDRFYKTFEKKTEVKLDSRVFHTPVALDKMMSEEFYYLGREKVLQPVIEVMNSYLDSLGWSQQLKEALDQKAKGAPYLFVGSSEAETAPPVTEMMRDENDLYPPMALYLEKPSKDWNKTYSKLMEDQEGEFTVLIWLGLTEYPKANKGMFKKKVVLGTDYEREIRFLSAVDRPVEVLQLTGILLDNKGKVIRAGAEGFLYEDSPFWVQALGAGTTVDDNAINKLYEEQRRTDLPGKPLAWKVALYNLMEQLLQRPNQHTL